MIMMTEWCGTGSPIAPVAGPNLLSLFSLAPLPQMIHGVPRGSKNPMFEDSGPDNH